MAAVCFICGKGTILGRSHTHHRGVAGGRWKKRATKTNRLFKANLQPVTVIESGEQFRIRLCTKCIKRIRKDAADGKRPLLKLAQDQTTFDTAEKAPVAKAPVASQVAAPVAQ